MTKTKSTSRLTVLQQSGLETLLVQLADHLGDAAAPLGKQQRRPLGVRSFARQPRLLVFFYCFGEMGRGDVQVLSSGALAGRAAYGQAPEKPPEQPKIV